MELLAQIKDVAELRKAYSEMQEMKKKLHAEWEEQNKNLLEQIDKQWQVLTEAETALRESTIKAYQETGNKQPAPGVAVRELTKLDYDPDQALKWGIEHSMALSLNKSVFEKIAKTTPLEFVKVFTEVSATIATDLSKVLEIKEDK